MKIEFVEDKWNSTVKFVPETPQEVASLLRMIKNSKKEPPSFYLSFSEYNKEGVWCHLDIAKYRETSNKTITSITK